MIDSPSITEVLQLVKDNPGFLITEYVNTQDWGDVQDENVRVMKNRFRVSITTKVNRLCKQGYLVKRGYRPPRYYASDMVPSNDSDMDGRIRITICGNDVLLRDYCYANQLDYGRVYRRLRSGWTAEEATTIPVGSIRGRPKKKVG